MIREAIGTRLNRKFSVSIEIEEDVVNNSGRIICNSSRKVNRTR